MCCKSAIRHFTASANNWAPVVDFSVGQWRLSQEGAEQDRGGGGSSRAGSGLQGRQGQQQSLPPKPESPPGYRSWHKPQFCWCSLFTRRPPSSSWPYRIKMQPCQHLPFSSGDILCQLWLTREPGKGQFPFKRNGPEISSTMIMLLPGREEVFAVLLENWNGRVGGEPLPVFGPNRKGFLNRSKVFKPQGGIGGLQAPQTFQWVSFQVSLKPPSLPVSSTVMELVLPSLPMQVGL